MRKKRMTAVLLAILLAGCAAPSAAASTASATATPDAFTSASVKNYYDKAALSGDALWNAMAAFQLAPVVVTVNPDGTPNAAVFIPGAHVQMDQKDYFVFGLAENQSKQNLARTNQGVLVLYGGLNSEKGPLTGEGAKIHFHVVDDKDLLGKLMKLNDKITEKSTVCEADRIDPLG